MTSCSFSKTKTATSGGPLPGLCRRSAQSHRLRVLEQRLLVARRPNLLYLADTDDRADVKQRTPHGLDTADTHHTAKSFTFDSRGALYFQEGTFHQSPISTPLGIVRNNNGCVWRFEPLTWKVDRYVAFDFANP